MFTAKISDGCSTYVNSNLRNDAGTTNGVYIIQFDADKDGVDLIVSWTMVEGDGNITLQAISLE